MFRGTLREAMAEFWGTLVLVAFGCGVNTAVTFGNGSFGNYLSINIGWGIGVILGVYASGGVSGGHLNPAVTFAMALGRDFAWSKVPAYILAQMLGAFLGAGLVYVTYFETFKMVDPDHSIVATTGVFCTYPQPHVSTFPGGFIDQIVGTALLLATVVALGDKRNMNPGGGYAPVLVGLTVLGIGLSFGSNAGYAINPARDFGPRLWAYLIGWGDVVFTHAQHFFWVPLVAPMIGGVVGIIIYDFFVGNNHPPEKQD